MTTTSATTSTGSVVTSGSTTYIASTASGLDTASLVAAAVATRTEPADVIDAKVTANTNKIAAYTQVQTLLAAMSTSLSTLNSNTNVPAGSTSLFDNASASIFSAGSASTALTGTSVTSAAADGSYELVVTQLAKSMKVTSTSMDQTVALGDTGSFTIGAGSGPTATINVTAGMTLTDVANAIAAQSGTTGVNATVIKIADGSSKLVMTSAATGEAIVATPTSGDDVLTNIGVTSTSGGAFANVLQAAQNATFTLDGTTISRPSNTISDVIPGVTLDLTSTSSATDPITLTVSRDTSGAITAVNNFLTAYNSLRTYLQSQETLNGDGTVASTAYLFADTTLRSLQSQLGSLVTGATPSGASSSISYLTQLGVTMDASGDLQLTDPTALAQATANNSAAFQSFFQSSYTPSDTSLLLMHNATLNSMNFTLDITAGPGGVTGATVNGQSGLFTVSGNELIGAKGTQYDGLVFAINATANKSISVNLQQGFADSISSLVTQYAGSTGKLQTNIASLTTTDTALAAQSASIRAAADTYQTSLINKYATMETQISSAKIVQQEIEAVLNAKSDN